MTKLSLLDRVDYAKHERIYVYVYRKKEKARERERRRERKNKCGGPEVKAASRKISDLSDKMRKTRPKAETLQRSEKRLRVDAVSIRHRSKLFITTTKKVFGTSALGPSCLSTPVSDSGMCTIALLNHLGRLLTNSITARSTRTKSSRCKTQKYTLFVRSRWVSY